MRNRLLRRCFLAAIGIHLSLVAAGGALAPHLRGAEDPSGMRTIDVSLETPEPPPPPVRIASGVAPHQRAAMAPALPSLTAPHAPVPRARPDLPPPDARSSVSPPVNARAAPSEEPGGALSLGTPSAGGDLPGLPSGRTPVGWVPGVDTGKGAGSGDAEGIGRPEPIAPAPQPPPRRVSVRVCAVTRLRPTPYCPECLTVEVPEGSEPGETCALHKYPPAPAALPPVRVAEEPRFTPARLVRSVKPVYPPTAVEGEHQGTASLKVEVRADGTCGEVEIARSSGSRELDETAVKAVRRWLWEPARRGDRPVSSTVRCRVRFELE